MLNASPMPHPASRLTERFDREEWLSLITNTDTPSSGSFCLSPVSRSQSSSAKTSPMTPSIPSSTSTSKLYLGLCSIPEHGPLRQPEVDLEERLAEANESEERVPSSSFENDLELTSDEEPVLRRTRSCGSEWLKRRKQSGGSLRKRGKGKGSCEEPEEQIFHRSPVSLANGYRPRLIRSESSPKIPLRPTLSDQGGFPLTSGAGLGRNPDKAGEMTAIMQRGQCPAEKEDGPSLDSRDGDEGSTRASMRRRNPGIPNDCDNERRDCMNADANVSGRADEQEKLLLSSFSDRESEADSFPPFDLRPAANGNHSLPPLKVGPRRPRQFLSCLRGPKNVLLAAWNLFLFGGISVIVCALIVPALLLLFDYLFH